MKETENLPPENERQIVVEIRESIDVIDSGQDDQFGDDQFENSDQFEDDDQFENNDQFEDNDQYEHDY